MLDGFVLVALDASRRSPVQVAVIRVDRRRVDRNVILDLFDDTLQRYRWHVARPRFPVTLHNSEDGRFVVLRPLPALVVLAADVGFIGFDHAGERFFVGQFKQTHRPEDAMRQVPRALIGRAQIALKLFRAEAFLCVHHQGDRCEPFVQRQMRVVEDRSRGGTELVAAFGILALVDDPARNLDRANYALGVLPCALRVVGLDAGNLRPAAF